MSTDSASDNDSFPKQIDAIIRNIPDWRRKRLAELRAAINEADPGLTEEVKWKKPSKPEGVPVWSHDGMMCVADTLKNAVRLTFPNGALLDDPNQVFNTRLDSQKVRAIDYFEDSKVDKQSLKTIVQNAAEFNKAKSKQ